MENFTVSAFADEIAPDLPTQIRALKANGISHLELRAIDHTSVSDFTLEAAKAYQAQLAANGLQVSSIGSPIGKIRIDEPFAPHLARFEHTLQIARIFKSPYVRMFSFYLPEAGGDWAQYRDEVIARWRQFLQKAKAYPEITLLHEDEKEIFGDTPERCLDLVTTLNDPQLQLAFDPANFVQCNVQVFPHALALLKQHVVYMHIKDAVYADGHVTPAGQGEGRVQDVLTALVAEDFHGFASIEPHLTMFDGSAELENSAVSFQRARGDGEVLFDVAAEALRKLFATMGQRWQ
ncbi:sugar phosphate isomerase/epimerase family protein [Lacticaseibacillus jixiensis]|uniref:sugar phosphate isomerase/epimerase family protein n=1 Tax=Lacticaseibacillus jixiensis TaxID=3231926 RepID=UPI0036F3FE05